MGCTSHFTCAACGYSAEVSGGGDAGMMICTTTIVCEDCRTLADIVTDRLVPAAQSIAPVFQPVPRRCKRSAKHRIREWNSGDPCPACGGAMQNVGEGVLWD